MRKFVLGVDYYIDNGRWVFTEDFLRRRGTCCKNKCRHCPYGNKNMNKNEEFRNYCLLLGKLHLEMRAGEEVRAEAIRTQMDTPGEQMTVDECSRANKLSARLWDAPTEQINSVVDQYIERELDRKE